MMKEHLGRCAEQLHKAVRLLANGSDTPQEKLRSMYEDTRFGSICEDDFPSDSLRDGFLTIRGSLIKSREPQVVVNIAAMPDEQARKVIQQICSVSRAVGRRSNSW